MIRIVAFRLRTPSTTLRTFSSTSIKHAKRGRRPVTPEEKANIVKLYQDGKSYYDIARMVQRPRGSVANWVMQWRTSEVEPHILPMRVPRYTHQDDADLCRLLEEGKSHAAIAQAIQKSVIAIGSRVSVLRRSGRLELRTAPSPRVPFTVEEDTKVIELYKAGKPYKAISRATQRSFASVNGRIVRLQRLHRLEPRQYHFGGGKHDHDIVRHYNIGVPTAHIAELLGLGQSYLHTRIEAFRKTGKLK